MCLNDMNEAFLEWRMKSALKSRNKAFTTMINLTTTNRPEMQSERNSLL